MLDEFYEKHSYPIPLTLGPNELDGVGLGHRRPLADCCHHRPDARVLVNLITCNSDPNAKPTKLEMARAILSFVGFAFGLQMRVSV